MLANRAIRHLPLQIGYLRRRLLNTQKIPASPSLIIPNGSLEDDLPCSSFNAPFEEALPISHFVTNYWTSSTSKENNTSVNTNVGRSREYYPWINKSSDQCRTVSSTTIASQSRDCLSSGSGGIKNDGPDSHDGKLGHIDDPRIFTNSVPTIVDTDHQECGSSEREVQSSCSDTSLSCDEGTGSDDNSRGTESVIKSDSQC